MGVFDYFTLGLGAMLGVAWFVLMAGNIQKAGPVGIALAFLVGAIFLIPIGFGAYCFYSCCWRRIRLYLCSLRNKTIICIPLLTT